jgi:hypothetical protein
MVLFNILISIDMSAMPETGRSKEDSFIGGIQFSQLCGGTLSRYGFEAAYLTELRGFEASPTPSN